jgi:hypothetical protein
MNNFKNDNRKIEKTEILNKQNKLDISQITVSDKNILSFSYIKNKNKYEILNKVSIDFEEYYKVLLYNFPEDYLPFIKVISYFDTEAGNYRFINDENYVGDVSYSIRQYNIYNQNNNYELNIRVAGYLYNDFNERLPLYNTLFLNIQLPINFDE